MDDYISRQAAIDALRDATFDFEACEIVLRLLPPAQPEIIRCKDCKYRMPYDWMFSETWQSQNMDDYPEDEIGCLYCDMAMKADDFCSRAERIKGDGMTITDVTDENKCCCSCKHNVRTRYDDKMHVRCNCDKDGHYIGYVANFGSVCDEWEGDAE